MVARRVGEHATRLFLIGKLGDGIEGPAKLEGADALKVLAFEKNLSAHTLVEGA